MNFFFPLRNAVLCRLPAAWRKRLSAMSDANRSILGGLWTVAIFVVLAKGIGAGKEILVAYRYGTSGVVDGYLFVFNLAQWPASVFFSVVSFVLIPYLVRLRIESPSVATELQQALIPITLVLGIAVSLIVAAVLWWLVDSGSTGLTELGREAALRGLPWLAPTVVFAFLTAVYSTWLMSQRKHANTFLEGMPALGIAVLLILWPTELVTQGSVLPLAIGTLLGFAVQAQLLHWMTGARWRPSSPKPVFEHWEVLRNAFGIVLLAQIVITSSTIVDQFFALRMGEGVLATLSYAQRLMALVLGLSATVLTRAMLPVFSGIDDQAQSLALAKRWSLRCAISGCVGAFLVFVLAGPVVQAFFERGEFSPEDTRSVAIALAVLGAQLPFYLASLVLVQWIGAIRRPGWLLVASVAGLATKVIVTTLLFDLGVVALAGGTVAMYALITVVVYGGSSVIIRRQVSGGYL